jgi:hypothetical protein
MWTRQSTLPIPHRKKWVAPLKYSRKPMIRSMTIKRQESAAGPANIFDISLLRPRDFKGKNSITVSPRNRVVLDGCEDLENLEISDKGSIDNIRILGPFPEHLWINGRFGDLHLGGSMQLVDWGGFAGNWNSGCVCSKLKPTPEVPDIMLVIFPRAEKKILRIGPEHCGKALAIRGPSTIEHIIIEPDAQMEHIMIQALPWLKTIELKGKVTEMEVSNTPRLERLSGNGLFLSCKTNGYHSKSLKLGGFWLNLDISRQECGTSTFVLPEKCLKTANDLEGRLICTDDYQVACIWAEVLGIEIEEAIKGLSFKQLVEVWKQDEILGQQIFLNWIDGDRRIIERRYYGMRIAMYLLLNKQKNLACRVRNFALTNNAEGLMYPMKHKPMVFADRREMEVFAPYDILDLEFLARASMDKKMVTVSGNIADCIEGQHMLLDWLNSLQNNRRKDFTKPLLETCTEFIYKMENGGIARPRGFFHFDIFSHLIFTLQNVKRCEKRDNLVEPLSELVMVSTYEAEFKAMFIVVLMQLADKASLRRCLSKLSSELNRSTLKVVVAFRMAGVKAFERLGHPHLKYPYHEKWEMMTQ